MSESRQSLKGEVPNQVPQEVMLSVCIITYNHEQYIRQALDSVLQQETNYSFEICIGEDDSGDGTREICMAYAQSYPDRIRLFLGDQSDNLSILGRPSGRANANNLRKCARGRYVIILEGDDYWTSSDKLQKQLEFLENNADYQACFHQVRKVSETGDSLGMFTEGVSDVVTVDDVLLRTRHHTSSLLFRNSDWIREPDSWLNEILLYDRYLMIRLALSGKIAYMDEQMSCYRIHTGGSYSGATDDYLLTVYIVMYRLFLRHIDEFNSQQRGRIKSTLRSLSYRKFKCCVRGKEIIGAFKALGDMLLCILKA